MQQLQLFDSQGRPVPKIVPRANYRATSQAAAKAIAPVAGTLRDQVRDMIRAAGGPGATVAELVERSGWLHQTVSARVHELARSGEIWNCGETRKTPSGRAAMVWRVRG